MKTLVILAALVAVSTAATFLTQRGADPYDDSWMHKIEEPIQGRAMKMHRLDEGKRPRESYDFWNQDAQEMLSKRLAHQNIIGKAKNIVFFLGDGMSVPTITAARMYKGMKEGLEFGGEEGTLFMDTLPYVGTSKTFCTDAQTADSACSATAYLGGSKANIGTIGVKPTVLLGDCPGMANPENHVHSILKWAQDAGMSTGVVTTTRITHASPSGNYAHTADRDWENDAMVTSGGGDNTVCSDIAKQLIRGEVGKKINVIFGGGRREFHGKDWTDPVSGQTGRRNDGLDLVKEWENGHQTNARSITTREQLLGMTSSNVDFAFGLFNYDHLAFQLENELIGANNPTLTEMTTKAIEILSKNPKGFFLFVEGGRIDHAHHDNRGQVALAECVEFDNAISKANEMTSVDDTIILVTADHAHVMSLAGYPPRGNSLFGPAGMADDNLWYPTLSYANGPGYRTPVNGTRHDISKDDLEDPTYQQTSGAPLGSETHGGDDVLILSRGPNAHLLVGVNQQSYIPHALGYAACIGPGRHFCDE